MSKKHTSRQTTASPVAEFSDPIVVMLDVVTGAMADYCRSHNDTSDACVTWSSGRDDAGDAPTLEFTVSHYSIGNVMEAWQELYELDLDSTFDDDDEEGPSDADLGELEAILGGAVG